MKSVRVLNFMEYLKKPVLHSFPLLLVLPETLPFDQGFGAMMRLWSTPVSTNTLAFMQDSWSMNRGDSYLLLALAGIAIVLSTSISVIFSGHRRKNSDTKN